MKGSFVSAFKGLCSVARVNEALARLHRADLLVLCYHGVLAQRRPDQWGYGTCDDADLFRAELRWLKQVFEPTDLAGLGRWYKREWTGRKGPVLITFDDGYRNNLTVAAPILKEESVPAVFFLATGFIGTSRILWNHEVRMRVLLWPEPEIRMPSGEVSTVPSERQARCSLADLTNQACKQLTEERRTEYLEYLRSKAPFLDTMDDPEARAFMTWDEARELANMGFEIGSHTVEHIILSRTSRVRVASELRESKAAIERELRQPCTAVAYPNGSVRDVNDIVFDEVRAAGYQWSFMTTPVWQKPGGDPHRIARVGFPGHTNLATFKFYASGLHTRLTEAA